MEYREGRCPKCHEVMQIPVDREKVICMFCGQEFSPQEARKAESVAYEAALESLRKGIGSVFENVEKTVKGFRRYEYEGNFEEYLVRQQDNLQLIRSAADYAPDRERAVEEIAEIITGGAAKVLDGKKGKIGRESMQMTMNMYMVTFVLPAIILNDNGKYADVTGGICGKWSRTFKNSNIQAADYETLKNGFKKKLCYITTAVCEGVHKPADCYELNVLKAFRDGYLSGLPEGETMIAQYYDMAPTIVKRVNKRKDHEEIYRFLYDAYIHPCVRLIEEERNEECREKYEEMVEMLREKYM